MTVRISGKSISVGEALRGRVTERTEEVLRKYFDGNYSGHITLSKDGFGFRTDCALHLDSGITLEAESNAADAYASADQALAQIEKRLRRYKSRLKDRSARKSHAEAAAMAELTSPTLDASSYIIEAPAGDDEHDETGYSPVIIDAATNERLYEPQIFDRVLGSPIIAATACAMAVLGFVLLGIRQHHWR